MGTKARIVLYADSEPRARAAAAAAFGTIERLEQVMSDYRKTSEVTRLAEAVGGVRDEGTTKGAVGEWIPISDDLAGVLRDSSDLWRGTGGAFDVTLSPVVRLWRRAGETGARPDPADLDEARAASGFDKVRLADDPPRVKFIARGMSLDFGGIGKGLAADAARTTLADLGLTRALVDLGGDLALGAAPPGAHGWTITVRTGLDRERTLTLADTCVATSGDLEQSSVIDGIRYAHIIDPRTGEPLTTRRAATVIHPDGATADALASAACVLGRDGLEPVRGRYPGAVIHLAESAASPDEQPPP